MKDTVVFKSTKDTETQNEDASERSCKYTIYKSIPENGLVVYIPGFGEDLGTYRDNFCMSICKEHRISAMTVDYHCIGSRPISGAQIYFEESDIEEIRY